MPHGSQHLTASLHASGTTYKLYKYNHTVPIYIFYATVCDNIDVTVQSRVPLPGLKEAMAAAVRRSPTRPSRLLRAKLSSLDR